LIQRKICVVTATRAEYGLLKNLMREIRQEPSLQLQIIATGTHLSHDFGFTVANMIEDGYKPNKEIEILLSSDTPVGLSKSMGLALIGFADAFEELAPDLVVILGDRFELLPIASAANMANIPIAHLHGGELTEGSKDETFRHSITKLSHLHFTALPEYRNRVIQMGEHPSRVFNVGAIGLDALEDEPLLDLQDLEKSLSLKFQKKNLKM
jgi:UDP-N-acetylglucosamine 2-epimerase (non-hydrolysing)